MSLSQRLIFKREERACEIRRDRALGFTCRNSCVDVALLLDVSY